jgi:hypothetical protein
MYSSNKPSPRKATIVLDRASVFFRSPINQLHPHPARSPPEQRHEKL